MTTIAWDGYTLAADSQTSNSGSTWRHANKVRKVRDGYVACCGDILQIAKFIAWYEGGCDGDVGELDEFTALMVRKERLTIWEGPQEIEANQDEKLAVGSGWVWAAAAMDFGKSAVDAVEYACTRDNCTGGQVNSVTMRKPKK